MQNADPSQSIHWARWRSCTQIETPPHSMQIVLRRPCGSQKFCGVQVRQEALNMSCSHMEVPEHLPSLQLFGRRPCGHFFLTYGLAGLFLSFFATGVFLKTNTRLTKTNTTLTKNKKSYNK